MISFLNPFFLAFGATVLVPLVLHMIQSSRTVRLPFSSIRFLKLAEKRSSRRIKMENFLLWLLRTLLLVLLTLAFAMPMIRTTQFGKSLGRAARDVAIVIDASYSMEYKAGRQTVWQEATDVAASIVQGLSDRDRFCVYLAGETVIPVCEQLLDSEKREETATRIRSLKPRESSSMLSPALMAANAVLEQENSRSEREIHVISDTHALPWRGFKKAGAKLAENKAVPAPAEAAKSASGEAAAEVKDAVPPDLLWNPSKFNDRTVCFVTLLGAPAPENTAPLTIDIEPRLITSETPCKVTVTLGHTGPAAETAVTLYLDNKEVARRSITLAGGSKSQISFALPPVGAGTHALRVETPDDSLARDNAFYFLIRAKAKLPTLCVGDERNTFFLRAALGAGAGGASTINVKYVTPDRLSEETLQSYVSVFLCNAMPLPGQELSRLEQYVKGGGGLVIFPGNADGIADYGAWSCLPSVPVSIADIPLKFRKSSLNWDKPQHPILAPLKEGGGVPTLVITRQLKCEKLVNKAQILVSTGSGIPFLMSRPVGRGEVFLFTVSADKSWSDFPLSPFYLPVVHQMVQYTAGASVFSPFQWTTEILPLQDILPEATRESVLKGPDGAPVMIRSSVAEGQTLLHAEGLMKPGIYTLSGPQSPAEVPALAINLDRIESDLTPVRADDVSGMLGLKNVQVSTSREDLFKKIEDFRIGKTLGEPLLWLLLLIAVIESFYSNWLARKGSKLTDSIVIQPSGKVSDKAS
jgi:hypothetical protein